MLTISTFVMRLCVLVLMLVVGTVLGGQVTSTTTRSTLREVQPAVAQAPQRHQTVPQCALQCPVGRVLDPVPCRCRIIILGKYYYQN